MTDQLLALLKARYPLRPGDAGTLSSLRANGVRLSVEVYEAQGLGRVAVVHTGDFLSLDLMNRNTLIVTPTERDLPLYVYDRILALGRDTLSAELYDTTVGGFASSALDDLLRRSADLPDLDPGVHWYSGIRLPQSISKRGRTDQSAALDQLAQAHFAAWLDAQCPPLADRAAKAAKTAAYVNGLLAYGSPFTDVFKKALGQEKAAPLVGKVLFGTA